jgi:hypothetical protein
VQVIVALVVTPEGLPPEGEVYVLAESGARTDKERAMRRRKLKIYWQRLHELQRQALTWDQRLEKLGAARDRAGRVVAGLVKTTVSVEGKLTFTADRAKLRTVRGREGRYLLAPLLRAGRRTGGSRTSRPYESAAEDGAVQTLRVFVESRANVWTF